jgi:quinol-cytochrome oxidoreductase complex cytochrome b subunit
MTRRWGWSLRAASVRDSADAVFANLLLHWFPAQMRAASLAWWPTAWLGTISWVLYVILLVSGLPLLVFYIPSVAGAYGSVKDIEHVVSFGSWLRAAHRMAAHLMVGASALHLVRVFVTGAYRNSRGSRSRREWNWVIGAAMFATTLLLSFTGYLLPWDQLAFWAVTVGTNIALAAPVVGGAVADLLIGGRTIGQAALLRFYILHIVVLPIGLAVLFAYHMWRIRKDGGLAAPDEASADDDTRALPAIPAVVRRIAVVSLATLLAVTLLAMAFPSPLLEPANPGAPPNPSKAPWYFLWLQEVVTLTTVRLAGVRINGAVVGGALLPGILAVLLVIWPWIDRSPALSAGVPFARERRVQIAVFVAIASAIVALTLVGLMRGPSWAFIWPWDTWPPVPARF